MHLCIFINSDTQSAFWDTSFTQEFNESPVFLKSLKMGPASCLSFLPVSLQGERVYTRLMPSHKRIISAVTILSTRWEKVKSFPWRVWLLTILYIGYSIALICKLSSSVAFLECLSDTVNHMFIKIKYVIRDWKASTVISLNLWANELFSSNISKPQAINAP